MSYNMLKVRLSFFIRYLLAEFAMIAYVNAFAMQPQSNTPPQEDMMDVSKDLSSKNLSQEIDHILRLTDDKIKEQDWASANGLLKKGLTVLGSSYSLPDTIDETGTKLILADSEERNGNLEGAVRIRRRILENRYILLQRKASLSK
jgi:hypothetical protein